MKELKGVVVGERKWKTSEVKNQDIGKAGMQMVDRWKYRPLSPWTFSCIPFTCVIHSGSRSGRQGGWDAARRGGRGWRDIYLTPNPVLFPSPTERKVL